ncbi:MAG TPA: DUF433 domain-containing protein [Chloroflexi bacterium]|nr:DUF433 domain-containing protein [Chloroflexota bacterium]
MSFFSGKFILSGMDDREELKQTIRDLLIEIVQSDSELRSELIRMGDTAPPSAVAESGAAYLVASSQELTEYLDFSEPDAIRLRDHRIWIEDILYEHVYGGLNAEQLATRFPTLTQADIYAVLLYYYRHQASLDRRLEDWLLHSQRAWVAQQRSSTPVIEKLRRLHAERNPTTPSMSLPTA